MDDLEIYKAAIANYGRAHQRMVAIEEMSELTKELCKWDRGMSDIEGISEEIADVLIMMKQLILMFDCEESVDAYVGYKTKRLSERLLNE